MQKVLSYGLGRRLRCKIECTFCTEVPKDVPSVESFSEDLETTLQNGDRLSWEG